MKWSKALKWAIPVWLLVGAVMVAINYAAEAKALPLDMINAVAAAYPLTALILKATGEDLAKWRAAFGSQDEE